MTDTVIADGRGAFARVVEPIPPQHQVKHQGLVFASLFQGANFAVDLG